MIGGNLLGCMEMPFLCRDAVFIASGSCLTFLRCIAFIFLSQCAKCLLTSFQHPFVACLFVADLVGFDNSESNIF